MEIGDSVLDAMVQAFQAASYPLLVRMTAPAQALFLTLFTIDFAWDLAAWTLADVPALFARALHRFLVFLILWGALLLVPYWVPELIEGFSELGEYLTGLPGLSPGAVFQQGLTLFFGMLLVWDSVVDIVLPAGGIRLITAGLLAFAFALIAFQLVRLLVEVTLAVGGLAIFLAFSASRRTFALADGYLRYLIHLGVRLFVCYLLIAVGGNFGELWAYRLESMSLGETLLSARELISIPVAASIWAGLVMSLPSLIASRIADGLSFAQAAPVGSGHA